MNGFALQASLVRGRCAQEEKAILEHCILQKIPYKLCNRVEEIPAGYIPHGEVEWCEHFIPEERTIPNYYPEFLQQYLFRSVWRADSWPLGSKVFIKPADRHKRFTGFVTSGGYRKKKKGPFCCSDIVAFTNEWRYYVADGQVLTGEWYSGDEINTPDAPELHVKIPEDFCGTLDFGTLKTGEFALVEAHPPYACGWYGKNHKLYVEWLIKGWAYLTR